MDSRKPYDAPAVEPVGVFGELAEGMPTGFFPDLIGFGLTDSPPLISIV